jgi:hypothetical protein
MLEHNTESALADYRNSLERRKMLAAKDESNTEWQHDVWISDNKFADALAAEFAFKKASGVYQDGLDIAKALADKDSVNSRWQHELAVSYGKIGDVLLAAYRKSLTISEALVGRDADNADWRLDLIAVNWQLAKMNDQAPARLDMVIAELKQLQSESKLAPDKADWIARAEADRAKLRPQ